MKRSDSNNTTAFLRLMTCLLFLPCFLLMEPSPTLTIYYISSVLFVYAAILYAFPTTLTYLNLVLPLSLILDLFLLSSFLYFLDRYTQVLATFYLIPIIAAAFNPKPAAPYGVAFLAGVFYISLAIIRGYWLVPTILQIISFFIIAFVTATLAQQFLHTYSLQANQDSLTKIHNRRFFNFFLTKLLKDKTPHTLILIDIDNFKQLNDTQGHHHGDYVLKVIATILKDFTRTSDVVARYGGDEFAIILPRISKQESKNIAERIRNNVLVNHKLLPYPIISVSIGIAAYPEDAMSTEELLKKADSALYKAKERGKNYVCIYAEDC